MQLIPCSLLKCTNSGNGLSGCSSISLTACTVFRNGSLRKFSRILMPKVDNGGVADFAGVGDI